MLLQLTEQYHQLIVRFRQAAQAVLKRLHRREAALAPYGPGQVSEIGNARDQMRMHQFGQLVDYGPEPAACIPWVQQHATAPVRGNHDHGVAQYVKVSGKNGSKSITGVTRQITHERISADERRYLGSLPISKRVTLDGA